MSTIPDILKCSLCLERFDNDIHKPMIITNCGHTFCDSCLSKNCFDNICPSNCNIHLKEPNLLLMINRQILSLLELNVQPLHYDNTFWHGSGLTIYSFCPIHEKSIVGYDFIDWCFKCTSCQPPELSSLITLKDLIENYYMRLSRDISLFTVNKAKLSSIDKIKDQVIVLKHKTASASIEKFTKRINRAWTNKTISEDDYQKYIYIRKQFINKVEKHFDIMTEFYLDYEATISNLIENEKQCEFIREKNYDVNRLPCDGIWLHPYKPVEYFLNRAENMEFYVRQQIRKFIRKFVARYFRIKNGRSDVKVVKKLSDSFITDLTFSEFDVSLDDIKEDLVNEKKQKENLFADTKTPKLETGNKRHTKV